MKSTPKFAMPSKIENINSNKRVAKFERADKKLFALNNYDYLLARIAERRGDLAMAWQIIKQSSAETRF
jgi:hypothetical protein